MTSTRKDVSALVQQIEDDKEKWIICTEQGVAYFFIEGRVLKKSRLIDTNRANLVVSQSSADFFRQVERWLTTTPYALLHVGYYGEVKLVYCHRQIFHLEQDTSRVLLIGQVCLVDGSYRDYLAEPKPPLTSGTVIRLNQRTFHVRVRANEHWIHVRSKDLTNGNVELIANAGQIMKK